MVGPALAGTGAVTKNFFPLFRHHKDITTHVVKAVCPVFNQVNFKTEIRLINLIP
jgi:hypothetical protein